MLERGLTSWLPIWMVDMDVMWAVGVVDHDHSPCSCVLVSLLHGLGIPVSPVHSVFKQGECKGMGQSARNGNVAVMSIHISIPRKRRKNTVYSFYTTTILLKVELYRGYTMNLHVALHLFHD